MSEVRSNDLPVALLDPPSPAEAPARAQQLYAVLSATNEAILRARSAAELYQGVCEAATGSGVISIAGVMAPADGDPGLLRVIARSGTGAGIAVTDPRISVDASQPEGRGLAGTAFQRQQPCVSQDLINDPRAAPWRAVQAAAGVRSGAAVPLVRSGVSVGVLLFFSPVRGAFDAATVRLLERLAENILFALSNFEREAERTRLSETLQRFRAAIDLSGDTVYLTDVETMRFVDVNETACRRLGYTRAELLTMGPKDLTIKSFDEVKAMFDRVIACAPEAIVTEQVAQSRNGNHWISEVSRRAVRAGERWMIVTISRDITERRRQERLQALQHSVTHQLAQTGAKRAVLEAVIADLSTTLRFEQGQCVIADDDHDQARRLAAWHRDGAVPFDARPGVRCAGDRRDHATGPRGATHARWPATLHRRAARRRQDVRCAGAAGRRDGAAGGVRARAGDHRRTARPVHPAQAGRAGAGTQRSALSLADRAVVGLVLGMRRPPPLRQFRRPQRARLRTRKIGAAPSSAAPCGSCRVWCTRAPTGLRTAAS